jgi:hypothetical protein
MPTGRDKPPWWARLKQGQHIRHPAHDVNLPLMPSRSGGTNFAHAPPRRIKPHGGRERIVLMWSST